MNEAYIEALKTQAIPAPQKILIILLPEEKRPEHMKSKDNDVFRDLFKEMGMP